METKQQLKDLQQELQIKIKRLLQRDQDLKKMDVYIQNLNVQLNTSYSLASNSWCCLVVWRAKRKAKKIRRQLTALEGIHDKQMSMLSTEMNKCQWQYRQISDRLLKMR